MEVILCQEVPKLGNIGDVVKVKSGYARNYLLPKNLAFQATAANLKRIEQQKAKAAAQYNAEKKEAEDLAKKIEVNDLERMYGSVTEIEIAQVLADEGFEVDKKIISLEKPIEELGIYEVAVKLHPEVTAQVRVWVAKK